jgi:predicted deacylase
MNKEDSPAEADQEFMIDRQEVKPGESTLVGIKVGALPSGTSIYINIYIYRSANPGPTLTVIGGLHGDEINGVETVRESIHRGVFSNLQSGSVIAIPLLNVFGFINFSRNVPDGKDVNRSFPGTKSGSLASRVAHAVTTHVLPLSDVIIDMHTGGVGRYNWPQIRYTAGDERAAELARAFGTRFVLEKPVIRKSLRQVAGKKDISVIVYESGEALRLDSFGVDRGSRGLERVMMKMGLKDSSVQPDEEKIILVKKASWRRAPTSGIFLWDKQSGDFVEKGEILGRISDPFGSKGMDVKSTKTGYIVGHTNTPVVSHGDALFHIGHKYIEL